MVQRKIENLVFETFDDLNTMLLKINDAAIKGEQMEVNGIKGYPIKAISVRLENGVHKIGTLIMEVDKE